MGEEKLLKQLNKTGNTPFYFENLTAEIEGNCFVPVQALNELRREALEQMEEKLLQPFRRTAGAVKSQDEGENERSEQQSETGSMRQVPGSRNLPGSRNMDNAELGKHRRTVAFISPPNPYLLRHPDVTRIYLDSCGFGPETWKSAVQECIMTTQKTCSLMLPHLPHEAETYFPQTYGRPERSWF